MPLCPTLNCSHRLPLQLPPTSFMLQQVVSAFAPDELRRREAQEREGVDEPSIPGGFVAWEEVVLNQDISSDEQVLWATFGMKGTVIKGAGDVVVVKFNDRLDFSEKGINIAPCKLSRPIHQTFGVEIGQRVVANRDLYQDETLMVAFATKGTCIRQLNPERAVVKFDTRVDGSDGLVNVTKLEIDVAKRLVGGFTVGQAVLAAHDIVSGHQVYVRAGTRGLVKGEYSIIRIIVDFEGHLHGNGSMNVLADEIKPC